MRPCVSHHHACDCREAKFAEMREALDDLQFMEKRYRAVHDAYGGASIDTARAWDKLREAGDRARAVLGAKDE